jgi:hypothetical protein
MPLFIIINNDFPFLYTILSHPAMQPEVRLLLQSEHT